MTDRERLMALFDEWRLSELIVHKTEREMLADFLLTNGVIAPPAKIGDTIYVIPSQANYDLNLFHNFQEHNRVYEQPIDHIAIWKDDYVLYTCDGLQAVRGKAYKDTWFLSKEEAEKALAERSNKECRQ